MKCRGPHIHHLLARIFLIVAFVSNTQATEKRISTSLETAIRSATPEQSIPYKTVGNLTLHLHVFFPDKHNKTNSAILFFHGGGWESGTPKHLFPHCEYLSKLGITAFAAEYRLAANGNTLFDCVEDARDAFSWLRQNAAQYDLDPKKIVVGGESSGGHLAACTAYLPHPKPTPDGPPGPAPAASILINPALDLTTLSWAKNKPGLSPKEPSLAANLSPLLKIPRNAPPALLLHGEDDNIIPAKQSIDFAKGMYAINNIAKLRIWEKKGHSFFLYIESFGMVDKAIIQNSLTEIEAFLQTHNLIHTRTNISKIKPIHLFAGNDGYQSFSELLVFDKQIYGSTYLGGRYNTGTLFRLNPITFEYKLLHEFQENDGQYVYNALTNDGIFFYGVCKLGGKDNNGTLFRITQDGNAFSVLHHFKAEKTNGFHPHSAPIKLGNFLYGTTFHGGNTLWGGTIYRFNLTTNSFELIHSFSKETGRHPTGKLTPVGEWLYGMASDFYQHEKGYFGTIFRINRVNLKFELLYRFNGIKDGQHPYDSLFHAGNGKLYGSTFGIPSDPRSKGSLFSYDTNTLQLSTIYNFKQSAANGSKPNGSLIKVDSSGKLYGVCHGSNAEGGSPGTLFHINPDGTDFTVLHSFTEGLHGNTPMRTPVYHNNSIYGISVFGGLNVDADNLESGGGFIFKFPLKP